MAAHLGQECPERPKAAALQHREKFQEGPGRCDRVTDSGVPCFFRDGDAQTMRQGIEAMDLVLTENHG